MIVLAVTVLLTLIVSMVLVVAPTMRLPAWVTPCILIVRTSAVPEVAAAVKPRLAARVLAENPIDPTV